MSVRELLVETLAYMPPHRVLDEVSAEAAARRIHGLPHTIVEIVAHLRFWQAWFLDRCEGQAVSMVAHAADGWPPASAADWPALHEAFLRDLERAAALTGDTEALDRPLAPAIEFPPMAGYTRRDALTHLAMHNAHHLGQVVLLRQLAGAWPPPDGSWTW